jgi:hypothetical protein
MAQSLRQGMTVEIAPWADGRPYDKDLAEYDGSLGVIKVFKGNSQGLSAVVEVKTGARNGHKPLVAADALKPL